MELVEKYILWDSVEGFASSVGMSVNLLFHWRRCKHRFVTPCTEPDSHGKLRDFYKPRGEFKKLLRAIDKGLKKYPLPDCFCGSRKGVSAVDCAMQHIKNPYILKLDLRKYFPNTSFRRVQWALEPLAGDEAVSKLVTELCTFDHHLPQGFPTSPTISEMVLLPLARKLQILCVEHDLTITTWIDDICISGSKVLCGLEQQIIDLFGQMRFKLNFDKKELSRPGNWIVITGVRIENGHATTRREFDAKFLEDIFVNNYQGSQFDEALALRIKGKLAWMRQVDPNKSRRYAAYRRQHITI